MKTVSQYLCAIGFLCYISSLFLDGLIFKGPDPTGMNYGKGGGILILAAMPSAAIFPSAVMGTIMELKERGTSRFGEFLLEVLSIFIGPQSTLAWFANPLIFFGFLFFIMKGYKSSVWMALSAFILGLFAVNFHHVPSFDAVPSFEVDHLGEGYYAWMMSFVLLFFASVVALLRREQV